MPATFSADRPRALVTGATSGLGLQVSVELARRGYAVTLMGRDASRLEAALGLARAASTDPMSCTTLQVDLSDLVQVRTAASMLRAEGRPLALLVNNAAVMAPPQLMTGPAGYELQLTVNHLAHHILTARLLPLLTARPDGRIVTVSSIRAQQGDVADKIPWTPLPYDGRQAYATSKLWNLAFALWLDNKLKSEPAETRSVAAHPGWTRTALHAGGPFIGGTSAKASLRLLATACLAQPVRLGAIPILDAATGPLGDDPAYLGPDGFRELRGRRSRPAHVGLAGNTRFQAWVVAKSSELTRTGIEL